MTMKAIVEARSRWNKVARLEQGRSYEILVRGDQRWTDGPIGCGADGYEKWWLAPFRWMRRFRPAPWFALIGSVGEKTFEIGSSYVLRDAPGGELSCYANDVWFMYWNNRGRLEVEVTPLTEL